MSSLGPNEAEFARSLARITANDSTFTRVDFSGWGIGDEGARRLVVALEGNTFVTILGLHKNGVSAVLVSALVGVLESVTSLRVLDLGGNDIGDLGARTLAEFLLHNSSVTFRLLLYQCGIGVEGARALAGALPSNSNLIYLDLGENKIGDVGASILATFLPGTSTLIDLDLEDNEISDAGVMALAEALPNNSSLRALDLMRNNISDVGVFSLVKALLVNCTVTTINLEENDMGEALKGPMNELGQINRVAADPQEALEIKVAWLRNLGENGVQLMGFEEREGRLRLLGFEESGVEEEVRRLEVVCIVGWLIDSGVEGEKKEAVTLVLDRLEHFMEAHERRRLFKQLLGLPERGMEVASSAGAAVGRILYWYAVDCGAAPGVLLTIIRAHPSLCTCKDVQHRLYPFMLLATIPEAGAGDVMELLLLNPNLVEGSIPGEQ